MRCGRRKSLMLSKSARPNDAFPADAVTTALSTVMMKGETTIAEAQAAKTSTPASGIPRDGRVLGGRPRFGGGTASHI